MYRKLFILAITLMVCAGIGSAQARKGCVSMR